MEDQEVVLFEMLKRYLCPFLQNADFGRRLQGIRQLFEGEDGLPVQMCIEAVNVLDVIGNQLGKDHQDDYAYGFVRLKLQLSMWG